MATKPKKSQKLHYNKEKLLEEYRSTYHMSMKWMAIGLIGAVVFFLIFIAFLAVSHTPHKPFYDTFKDRFTIEYEGTKLPYYEE